MIIKVGINGFGRIGRIISRACLENSNLQLSAINDPAISIEYICYLIKFDSTHGKLKAEVTYEHNEVIINDHHIKVSHEKLPPDVPWNSAGVQYVVEASGAFTNYEKAKGHLSSKSVKRVIVTAPSVDVPMIILGVNDHKINKDVKVISCASSTLYCLAPVIKVLDETFGVAEGSLTSIHAMTPSLKPLDGLCLRGRHWRDHRSIHQNIIPAATGACKALGKILPQVKDKLSGLAFRVPIVNVSVLDLTIRLNNHTTLQEIVKAMGAASKTTLGKVIRISSEETVSSDFIGESHSCIFDEDASIQLNPNFFKIICWYENEYSYACRVVDTIFFCEKQEHIDARPNLTNRVQAPQPNVHTERFRKTIAGLSGDGNAELRSRIRTLDGLVKPPAHESLTIRKPTATVPSLDMSKETKKWNEIFKVWNDTNESAKSMPKQNRTAFFQSCMMFTPSSPLKKIDCTTAHERLENVKREFSKMVNITEDLLKKTHSTQSSARSITIDEVKGKGNFNKCSLETNESVFKEDLENNEQQNFNSDCKSLDSINEIFEPNYSKNNCAQDQFIHTHNEDTLPNNEEKIQIEEDFKTLIDTADSGNLSKKDDKHSEKLCSKTFYIQNCRDISVTRKNHDLNQANKTFSTLIAGLTKSIESTQDDDTTTATQIKNSGEEFDKYHERDTVKEMTTQNIYSELQIPSTTSDFENNTENKQNINNIKWSKQNNLKIVDHELRQRNIFFIDEKFVTEDVNFSDKLKLSVEKDKRVQCNDITIVEELKSSTAVVVVPKEESISEILETTTTITNNSFNEESKQDIYDKLDSDSASDSNNSFEMNERKSQVIQISDITNSLEDLTRLDNICRIIEISDELSDNLFSALNDDNKGCDLKKKKWSFKDLCDRIKLDEFCNKVFGRNAR